MKDQNVFLGVLHDHGKLSNFSIISLKLSNLPCDLHVLLLAYTLMLTLQQNRHHH